VNRFQCEQMAVLPPSFFGDGSIGISGVGDSIDSLLSINCRAVRMSGDMRSCDRLACGTGSRAGGNLISDFTGSGMSVERRLANHGHPEFPGIYPSLQCFNREARAMILRVFFLKVRHDTLGTINRPKGYRYMVSTVHEQYQLFVFAGK
jgi:hypothetical protein